MISDLRFCNFGVCCDLTNFVQLQSFFPTVKEIHVIIGMMGRAIHMNRTDWLRQHGSQYSAITISSAINLLWLLNPQSGMK